MYCYVQLPLGIVVYFWQHRHTHTQTNIHLVTRTLRREQEQLQRVIRRRAAKKRRNSENWSALFTKLTFFLLSLSPSAGRARRRRRLSTEIVLIVRLAAVKHVVCSTDCSCVCVRESEREWMLYANCVCVWFSDREKEQTCVSGCELRPAAVRRTVKQEG